jgi:hypothetical protein
MPSSQSDAGLDGAWKADPSRLGSSAVQATMTAVTMPNMPVSASTWLRIR